MLYMNKIQHVNIRKNAKHNSHAMENYCDLKALMIMDKAGYNPNAMTVSLLSSAPISNKNLGLFSSHPHPKERDESA